MKRALLFLALLAAFVLWMFPHQRIVEQMLVRRLAGVQADIALGDVSLSWWPPGYEMSDVRLEAPGFRLSIQSLGLQLLFGSAVRARACGGSVTGTADPASQGRPASVDLRFEGLNPALCIEGPPIQLSGSFSGSLKLTFSGACSAGSVVGSAADQGSLVLEATDGTVSGYLPVASEPGDDGEAAKPIGSWEFVRAQLRARLERGDIVFENASADAEGVHWELSQGRVSRGPGGKPRVAVDLRARRVVDSPRAKAVLGIFPRAGEDSEGWRRYRITGGLDAPRIVGLK
jgi:type II secretion system protein N